MVQNLVLNNSAHNFSTWADGIRIEMDQTKVIPSAGTDAAINAGLRGQLESDSLTAAGQGINADHRA